MASDRWYADLPFRGTRTYVHSTSICNHLRDRFGSARRVELVMREWMDSRVQFAPLDEVVAPKATLRLEDADGSVQRFGLVDDPDHPLTQREPFDEDALVADAPLAGRIITVAPSDAGTFFDRLISANKALIARTVAPGVRLIASKIVLPGFPGDEQTFQLRLDGHVGKRIFRSAVIIDDEVVGELVFYGQ